MPRRLLERRYWERRLEAIRALGPGTRWQWRVMGPPGFIDYWPEVPATFPEKLVFSELVRRQISFRFSWYYGDIKVTPDAHERYRPDFWLIDYKVMIEVYGSYWHSRPEQFGQDAYRAFLLEAEGYKLYVVSDYEVIHNVREAIDKIPEIRAAQVKGGVAMVGDRPIHPSASIRARMRKWPKTTAARYKDIRLGKQGVRTGWKIPLHGVEAPEPELGPIFRGLSPEGRTEAIKYRGEYERWEKSYKLYQLQEELYNDYLRDPKPGSLYIWYMAYLEWREAYKESFGFYPEEYIE